jgi:hypothetical protein
MFALLGLVFPFIKGFLGDGLVEKYLNHKKDLAASANEREKLNIDADVKVLEFELERRKAIRDLQLKEYEHPFLWWPKFILMLFVCLYWAARFMVKLTGLNDFNVAIAELSDVEAVVSSMVLAYMFLGADLKRAIGGLRK